MAWKNEQHVESDDVIDSRLYGAEAATTLLPLTQAALGDSGAVRKTEAFWQWKHHASPFGESVGLYAWDEEAQRAAALRILLRWRFVSAEGQLFQAARAVDTATHPDYQRQGLFTRLTLAAIEELTTAGFDFIFNTPNAKSLPGYLKMDWQIVARWPLYIKPLRPLRMVRRRLKQATASSDVRFEDYFSPSILTWQDFHARYGEQITPLLDGWEEERTQVGLRTQRSLAYFAWRYGGHPHITYGIFPFEEQGALTGFAVLRPNLRFGWQETVLTELILAHADVTLGRQVLRQLTRQLHGDYLIAHFNRGTLEQTILRRSGFLRAPRQSMTFTARPLQAGSSTLIDPMAWDLSLGDLELF